MARLKDEIRSLILENDSYKRFLSGEHKSLICKDSQMRLKAEEMVQGGHSMRRDSLMNEKIEKLEAEIANLNVFEYTIKGVEINQEPLRTPESPGKRTVINLNFSVRGGNSPGMSPVG